MAATSSMEDISHKNDANDIESGYRQEKRNQSLLKKRCGRRERDYIPLLHAKVPHLSQAAMRLGKERNIKKAQKKTIQAKKKSFGRRSFRKQRRGSSKTVLYNQPRSTISMTNPTIYSRIWEQQFSCIY